MDIMSYLDLFLGAFLNVICCLTIVKKIFKTKIVNNKYKIYIYIIIVAIGIALINKFNKNMFKAIFTIPLITISIFKVFDVKISKSLYYTIVASFYMLIGDMIIGIIIPLLNLEYAFIATNILGKTIGNILVIIATIPLLKIKFMAKIFKKIDNIKLNYKYVFKIFILFLAIGSAFVFKSSINVENIVQIITNFIIFIIFVILLYISYRETQKVNKISDEYNSLINYLDKYEKEIVEKRKIVHDFKNQLIVINSYVDDSKKLKQYLNGIIEEQKNIKETKIIKNIDKLPKGLKGLVYYKLSQISDEINISLNVKSKFNGYDLLSAKDNKNILKVIGILIDNAIESSLKTKNKYILIEIEMHKGIFEICITNSHDNKVEKSKITELGFSTKGKNRGYGLSLAKDIIRDNENYSLSFDITEVEFKATFTIKTK